MGMIVFDSVRDHRGFKFISIELLISYSLAEFQKIMYNSIKSKGFSVSLLYQVEQ